MNINLTPKMAKGIKVVHQQTTQGWYNIHCQGKLMWECDKMLTNNCSLINNQLKTQIKMKNNISPLSIWTKVLMHNTNYKT
jgi:hypothetical protein